MDPVTYGDLYAQLQSQNEDYSLDFQQQLPAIIRRGELRLIRDTDLDNLDYQLPSGAVNLTTGIVSKPAGLIRERVLFTVDTGGEQVGVPVKHTNDFVQQWLIAAAAADLATGEPKYFAEYTSTQWIVAPLPDQAYTFSVRGIYPIPLLGDNDQDSSPAAIAASQNTTADTPLTLSSSPWTPTNGVAVQIALTSSGDMSANTFVIVGLDADGNALTVSIAGPDAGYVTTNEYFSSVTSITPSATDDTNDVTVGYYADNTTWMSTRFPDALFNSCMIDACMYLKRFSAQQVAQNEYNACLLDVIQQTRNLQRSDLDDIFAVRQLLNGPPAQQQVAPNPSPATQPGTG